MKIHFRAISILLFLLIGCNQNSSQKSKQDTFGSNKSVDTISNTPLQKVNFDSTKENDAVLISFSDSILKLIKTKKYVWLSEFIHPEYGLRFSPYGMADTLKNQRLSAQQLIELAKNKKPINWGVFEGTGEPIKFNISNYFKRFVYDVDFINAEKKSLNKIIGPAASSSNVTTIYSGCDFVQYYFSGFNKKYEGMDWKSLVLVLKKENMKIFLVGILHDEWKI